MKTIKKISIAFVLLLLSFNASAQMTAAKKIEPTFIKSVTVEASVDEVWALIKNPKNYATYANGVTDFECSSSFRNAEMSFKLPYDSKRTQTLQTLNHAIKLMTFFVNTSDYREQIWVYNIELEAKGDKTKVKYVAIASCEDYEKSKFVKLFRVEANDILSGIASKF